MAQEYENLHETELASRAAQGDEDAFAEIVRRYSPRVFRFAGRFFRRYSLVEEAAQEVFLKAFLQLKNFEGRGSLEGWLTRITVTTCINLLRTAKRQPELTISDLTDDETSWLEEKLLNLSTARHRSEEDKLIAADLVNRVLEALPPEDTLVLTMIDGEGASIKEAAALTGWSESKVKVKAFRARKRMREALEKLLKAKDDKFFKSEKTIK
ncbi:MAG: sigma-70 family RNA polymerase sigma factor [Acidobacteria bacterium]|nr:sigma-70 family RNA polymerase sigma factor [Acidobacteriota bacterium]MCA1637029.1 sigma-70 family RNA polymerase sigma factor [Acidobacteriota bacterium]